MEQDGNGQGAALTEITAARRALARAQDIYSVLEIRDVAKAAAVFAEAQDAGEAANEAKEVQLRAERKAGGFYAGMERAKPGPKLDPKLGSNSEYKQAIDDMGVGHSTAHRWQKLAEIPDEEFEGYVSEARESGKELTQAGALRLAAKLNRPAETETPELPMDKYRVIYADPPWKYGNSGVIGPTDNYGHAERHYPSMSIQELCDLPVADMAADNAVLFLWVTSPLLEECFDVIRAWGFQYKTSFVWDKVGHNFGHYNSVRHEFLLVCTRGSCTPDNLKLYDSVQSIEKTRKHSEKPEEFRRIIDDIYPHGNRIELFARAEAEGWQTWGNEPC